MGNMAILNPKISSQAALCRLPYLNLIMVWYVLNVPRLRPIEIEPTFR